MAQIERTPLDTATQTTANSSPQVTLSSRIQEIRLYTYPNRSDHFEDSGLHNDIEENPALFWGSADF